MADVTHSSRSCIRVGRVAKGSARMLAFEESTCASTAVISFGNVVVFDSTGATTGIHRIIRASSAADGTPFLASNIVGVAAQGSTSDGSTTGLGTRGRDINVYVADPGTEFEFPTKVVIASTIVGSAMELTWDSTSNFNYVATNSTAGDARVYITGISAKSQVGDTGGWLLGRFHSSAVNAAFSGL